MKAIPSDSGDHCLWETELSKDLCLATEGSLHTISIALSECLTILSSICFWQIPETNSYTEWTISCCHVLNSIGVFLVWILQFLLKLEARPMLKASHYWPAMLAGPMGTGFLRGKPAWQQCNMKPECYKLYMSSVDHWMELITHSWVGWASTHSRARVGWASTPQQSSRASIKNQ